MWSVAVYRGTAMHGTTLACWGRRTYDHDGISSCCILQVQMKFSLVTTSAYGLASTPHP